MFANPDAPASRQVDDDPGKDLGQFQNDRQERMPGGVSYPSQILEQSVDEKESEK